MNNNEVKKKNKLWLVLLLILSIPIIYFVVSKLLLRAHLDRQSLEEPIKVPYLKEEVNSNSKIYDDMIGYKSIKYSEYTENLEGKIIVDTKDIVGKCTTSAREADSYFYVDELQNCTINEESE